MAACEAAAAAQPPSRATVPSRHSFVGAPAGPRHHAGGAPTPRPGAAAVLAAALKYFRAFLSFLCCVLLRSLALSRRSTLPPGTAAGPCCFSFDRPASLVCLACFPPCPPCALAPESSTRVLASHAARMATHIQAGPRASPPPLPPFLTSLAPPDSSPSRCRCACCARCAEPNPLSPIPTPQLPESSAPPSYRPLSELTTAAPRRPCQSRPLPACAPVFDPVTAFTPTHTTTPKLV